MVAPREAVGSCSCPLRRTFGGQGGGLGSYGCPAETWCEPVRAGQSNPRKTPDRHSAARPACQAILRPPRALRPGLSKLRSSSQGTVPWTWPWRMPSRLPGTPPAFDRLVSQESFSEAENLGRRLRFLANEHFLGSEQKRMNKRTLPGSGQLPSGRWHRRGGQGPPNHEWQPVFSVFQLLVSIILTQKELNKYLFKERNSKQINVQLTVQKSSDYVSYLEMTSLRGRLSPGPGAWDAL